MTLSIESHATPFKLDHKAFSKLLEHVARKGYEPLILRAKTQFTAVFGVPEKEASFRKRDLVYQQRLFNYRVVRRPSSQSFSSDLRFLVAGDIFFSLEDSGIFYMALMILEPDTVRARSKKLEEIESQLEVGFIGDTNGKDSLGDFVELVSESLKEQGAKPSWEAVQTSNPQFAELCQDEENRFVLASDLPQQELELAETLEDLSTRNLAVIVRRAGGILMGDLLKKADSNPEELQAIVERLGNDRLLSQEYVVICKKTSNQVNRVDTRDKIEEMGKIGVRCSCGNPISEERIEELIVPTPMLQKMLDQSYWMTTRLVQLLENLQIPKERILLNLQEGAEEIDAFVDLDGTLLMFELKDSEFSMGHAYPFGGRIGLYKPDFAVIVSTRRVASEVKAYFERIEPEIKQIVYVGSLNELTSKLQDLTTKIRTQRAKEIISLFEPLAEVEAPLSQMLGLRLGLSEKPKR